MINGNQLFLFHLFVAACAIVVAINKLPLYLMVTLGYSLIVFMIVTKELPTLIGALSLFGLPFFGATSVYVGISPSTILAIIDVLLFSYICWNISKYFLGKEQTGIRKIALWWFLFLLFYAIGTITGPESEYSKFVLLYLLVYGNFFFLSGIVIASNRVKFQNVHSLGAFFFSFIYPVIGISIFNVGKIADAVIGLRAVEGINPIDQARMAGFLVLGCISSIIFNKKLFKKSLELFLIIIISAPIAWYSYTRQVYVAIIITSLTLYLLTMLSSKEKFGQKVGYRLIFIIPIVVASVVYIITELISGRVESRVTETGWKIDRFGMWQACFEIIINNPIVGLGVGGFQKTGIALWPHNWFLEAWVELGFIGLLLTGYAGYLLVSSLVRRVHIETLEWLYMGFYFLIVIQVSGDIARNSAIFLFLVIASYSANLDLVKNRENTTQ
jgi:O-antigen ligase